MDFYKVLEDLATTPSGSEKEYLVANKIFGMAKPWSDLLEKDDEGNLYAYRKGSKPGTIMLCAHMDKVLDDNLVGYISSSSSLEKIRSLSFQNYPLMEFARKSRLFTLYHGLYHDIEVNFDINSKDTNSLSIQVNMPDRMIERSESSAVFALPKVVKKNGVNGMLAGKFDDAMGLTLILDVLNNFSFKEMPNIVTLFTVNEEKGMLGAKGCVQRAFQDRKYLPDAIIVLDTTRREDPGNGIVMYENCGHRDDVFRDYLIKGPAEFLEESVKRYAKISLTPLNIHQPLSNDSYIFGNMTDIPTIALEVPIIDMHMRREYCSEDDVEYMRNFLNGYLRNVLFEGITEVKK